MTRRHSIFRFPPLANPRSPTRFSPRPALRAVGHGTLWLYRVATNLLLVTALLLGVAILLLRYWVLPDLGQHRDQIAQALSNAARQKITLGAVDGRWDGFRPRLVLRDLRVYDRSGTERLALAEVDATLSWTSLLGEVRFHSIDVNRLALEVRRDERGVFSVAGIVLEPGEGDDGFGNWLLEQHRVAVHQSSLTWIDETLGGTPLLLKDVELLVEKRLGTWRLGMQAVPPLEVASPIDLRGELRRDGSGRARTWHGRVYLGFSYADLAALGHWLAMPADIQRGAGGLEVWADVGGSRITQVLADIGLADVSLRMRTNLPYLDLARLTGRVAWSGGPDSMSWAAHNLAFTTPDGLELPPADISYRRTGAEDDPKARSEATFDALDLAAVVRLIDRLPLDDALRARLAEMNPRGRLNAFELRWTGPLASRTEYAARGSFDGVTVAPSGYLPGFATVSGNVDATQAGGRVDLRARGSELVMPKVFAGPLPLDDLSGRVSWTMTAQGAAVRVESVTFANAHLAGQASAVYTVVPGQPGTLDLAGTLQRGEGREAWRYLPLQLKGEVREWLQQAISAGRVGQTRFRLSGDLARFPFAGANAGVFEVVAPFEQATFAFDPAWPALEGLRGSLEFHNNSLTVRLSEGHLFGLRLLTATATIGDLSGDQPVCVLRGEAEGPTADFLRFIAASPLQRILIGVTDQMQASGTGGLGLVLELPLEHLDDTRVSGRYRFAANTLEPGNGAPRVDQLTGELLFSDREVRLPEGTARVLGFPLRFTAERTPQSKGLQIRASGRADAPAIRALVGQRWAEGLSGETEWQGTLHVQDGSYELAIDSELRGLVSALPAPLAKDAAAPLRFNLQRRSAAAGRELTVVNVGNVFSAQWLEPHGAAQALRAEVRFNEPAPLPQRDGVWLAGRVAVLDVDRWRPLLRGGDADADADATGGRGGITLSTPRAILFGRQWNDVSVQAVRKDDVWQGQVDAREVAGTFTWNTSGPGNVYARLGRLHLPQPVVRVEAPAAAAGGDESLPGLDVQAEDFRAGERQFGKLQLLAVPEGRDWRVRQLDLRRPEGSLAMTGIWRAGATPVMHLDLQADVKDLGAWFAQIGLPQALAGGSGKMTAQLAWKGPPESVDTPTLNGTVKLEAKQGRFVKIEPGLGKLIGVLSLQALPRRVTLDFNDVFSDGFAFDRVSAAATIDRGVAHTSDFMMVGPAARVEMSGDINLAGETQRLDVKVLPSMSESVALGAAIVNPAVGLATLLAQKVLKDPIGQMIAFDYEVSGTWADPIVLKKRRGTPEQTRQGRK